MTDTKSIQLPECDIDRRRTSFDLSEENIKKEKMMESSQIISTNGGKNYAPRVCIWGCGGFGINQVKDYPFLLNYPNVSYRIIDTSESNTHKQEIHPDIEITYVGSVGHGAIRNTNIKVIQQKIEHKVLNDPEEFDLDIVIFSLPGGSGSVVGPFIVRALAKKDRPIIIITVAGNHSTVACENTLNTIVTLENFTKDSYANMMLFDNSLNGRKAVDQAVKNKLETLLSSIDLNNIRELDKSDISIAMRPFQHRILSGVRGLFVMRINDGCEECYDDSEIVSCHSTIHVHGTTSIKDNMHSSITYEGEWINDQKSRIIRFGLPIPEKFMKQYETDLKRSQAASGAHTSQSSVKVLGATELDSGMVV